MAERTGQLAAGEAVGTGQLAAGGAVGAGQLAAGGAVGAGQLAAGGAVGTGQLAAGGAAGAGQLAADGEGVRQIVVGEAAGAAARPALDLRFSHGGSSCSLKIEDKQLATEVIRGAATVGLGALICLKLETTQLAEVARVFGFGAGVASMGALAYFWMNSRGSAERAVREALEVRPADGVHALDPQVEEIRRGSLLVKLRFHTPRSFLQFVRDYESQKVKRRLEQELSKVGFTEELTITIENKEEVEEQKKELRYVSFICEQKS